MFGDKTRHEHIIKTKKTWVQSNDAVTLLGVIIDKNLTFKKHRNFSQQKTPKILGNAFNSIMHL